MFCVSDFTLHVIMNLFCEGVAMVKLLEGFQAVKRFAHYDIFFTNFCHRCIMLQDNVFLHFSFCDGALMLVMKVFHVIHLLMCFILLTVTHVTNGFTRHA